MTVQSLPPKIKSKSSSDNTTTTIGKYLLDKLYEYGVEHIFGLPGDYIIRFDKMIEQHPIKFINATRENTAGYMADAYSRMRGLGVVCITYGVGINITNAISQAYVESSPLVLISGAAGTNEMLRGQPLHHLIHKASSDRIENTQLEIFKHITVDQAVLDDPTNAAAQIDRVLYNCLRHHKPVYIEIPRDKVDAVIDKIEHAPLPHPQSDKQALQEALNETAAIIQKSSQPVIWIGHEIQRFGLEEPLLAFAEKFNIPIVSSLLGKTAISEFHPLFAGVYAGLMSRSEIVKYVDSCDCALILGLIMSDVDTGIFTAKLNQDNKIIANAEGIKIKNHHYHNVLFYDFLNSLPAIKVNKKFQVDYPRNLNNKTSFEPKKNQKITAPRVFECIQSFLKPEHILVTDVGDCLFGSEDLVLEKNSFLASAYFATLGFGTPGAIGAQIAVPERRVISIVGDGAFQMTCMELSTAVRYHLDPVIIVLNNHGYGTERPLCEGAYNDILDWDYTKIPQVLQGGVGIKVKTEEELKKALQTALSKEGYFI